MYHKIVENYEDFKLLNSTWRDFVNTSKQKVFQNFDIYDCLLTAFNDKKRFNIILIYDEGRIVSILPLAKNKFSLRYSFMDRDLLDYQDVLFHRRINASKKQEVVVYIVKEMCMKGNMKLRLNGISEDSELFQILAKLKDDIDLNSAITLVDLDVCPYIKMDTNWDDYWQTVSKKVRKDTERQYRNHFENKVKIEDIPKEDIAKCVDDMFEMKRKYPPPQGLSGLMSDNRYREYLKNYALKRTDLVDFKRLVCEGEIVAYVYSFEDDSVYYYLIPANVKKEKVSLGRIALTEIMKMMFNYKKQVFDFMRGDEEYKFHFTKLTIKVFDIYVGKIGKVESFCEKIRKKLFLLWIKNFEKKYVETFVNDRRTI